MRLLFLLLAGCSGQPFTGLEDNEQGNNPPSLSDGAGEAQTGGNGGQAGMWSNGGSLAGSPPQAGSSGASAMAGGPPMGEGGEGGVSPQPGGPAICLANYQTLDCARVCTNSQSDCQGVLNCAVQNNSFDLCLDFTDTGISLAHTAERNCCND